MEYVTFGGYFRFELTLDASSERYSGKRVESSTENEPSLYCQLGLKSENP